MTDSPAAHHALVAALVRVPEIGDHGDLWRRAAARDLVAALREAGELRDPATPILCADVVLLRLASSTDEILLIRRHADSDAFPGHWALPGGTLERGETFADAAARELREETGIVVDVADLGRPHLFDRPDRDPRGRVVSAAFRASVPLGHSRATAGDDADRAEWLPLDDVLRRTDLAFDHAEVIARVTGRRA